MHGINMNNDVIIGTSYVGVFVAFRAWFINKLCNMGTILFLIMNIFIILFGNVIYLVLTGSVKKCLNI